MQGRRQGQERWKIAFARPSEQGRAGCARTTSKRLHPKWGKRRLVDCRRALWPRKGPHGAVIGLHRLVPGEL
jgi:hypothetical protein